MKIDVKQLLEIAKASNIKDAPKEMSNQLHDVERFILELKIKDGLHNVKKQSIYRAFELWSLPNTPVKIDQFQNIFGTQFAFQKISEDKGAPYAYKLNYGGVQLLKKVSQLRAKREHEEKQQETT